MKSCAIPGASDPNIPYRFYAYTVQPGENPRLVSVLRERGGLVSEDGLSLLIRENRPAVAFDGVDVSCGFIVDAVGMKGITEAGS